MLQDARQWLNSGKIEDTRQARSGATALHVAAAKGYSEVLRYVRPATTAGMWGMSVPRWGSRCGPGLQSPTFAGVHRGHPAPLPPRHAACETEPFRALPAPGAALHPAAAPSPSRITRADLRPLVRWTQTVSLGPWFVIRLRVHVAAADGHCLERRVGPAPWVHTLHAALRAAPRGQVS